MVSFKLDLTHVCGYTCLPAHLCTACKTLKSGVHMHCCTQFCVHTRTSDYTKHTRYACHKFMLYLLHYTCGVQVQ